MVDEGPFIAIPSNLKLSTRCLEAVRKREKKSIGCVGVRGAKRHSKGFAQLSDASMLRVPVLNMPWEENSYGKYAKPTKFVIHSGIEIGLCRLYPWSGWLCS